MKCPDCGKQSNFNFGICSWCGYKSDMSKAQGLEPEIGDFVFAFDGHCYKITKIEEDLITATCCHGDEVKFKPGQRDIFRRIVEGKT